jgi:hypothetical protein
MAAKAGLIEDNRPPTPFTTSSESDRSPQLAENKGFKSIRSLRFECAKLFVDLLSTTPLSYGSRLATMAYGLLLVIES